MTSDQTYLTSPTKRHRRTKADMQELLDAVRGVLAEYPEEPITIRHLFYRLVSGGAIEKTEREYRALCHHLATWRRSGNVPWDGFTDNTRWRLADADGFNSVQDALRSTAELYRRDLWADQDVYVEVWCEKDAIASILWAEARRWGVSVFPFKGFSSLSALYESAMTFREQENRGKDIHVYYFGDHDPSGVAIEPTAERTLREDFGVQFALTRMAVTVDQIVEFDLPTRPTKKSDTRSKTFQGESVEVDAMSPGVLRTMVRECIEQHIDFDAWEALRIAERNDRAELAALVEDAA